MYGIRKRHLIIAAFLIFPVVVAFSPDAVTGGIKSQLTSIIKIPLVLVNSLSNKLQDAITPKGIFLQQINSKDIQIKTLQEENARIKELFLENQRLKELLSFKQNLTFKVLPAQVIAKDPANWRHTIIIDKGAASGIKKYEFVISQQGLVGRLCETGKNAAKAILLTDPDFRVAAVDQRSREEMIVAGSARSVCLLKYIHHDADIKIKDAIVTSGLGGFCPKGILIGEVIAVRKSPEGLTEEAYVRPAARLNRLENVLVLME